MTGWLNWGPSTDNTNTIYLLDSRYAVLAAYFGNAKNVYKCPADIYASGGQRKLGWQSRCRSVSGNIYIGEGNGWAKGSWGDPGGPNKLTIYRGAKKASELQIPGPAQTWVYMDEHPDSINDAGAFPPDSLTISRTRQPHIIMVRPALRWPTGTLRSTNGGDQP